MQFIIFWVMLSVSQKRNLVIICLVDHDAPSTNRGKKGTTRHTQHAHLRVLKTEKYKQLLQSSTVKGSAQPHKTSTTHTQKARESHRRRRATLHRQNPLSPQISTSTLYNIYRIPSISLSLNFIFLFSFSTQTQHGFEF